MGADRGMTRGREEAEQAGVTLMGELRPCVYLREATQVGDPAVDAACVTCTRAKGLTQRATGVFPSILANLIAGFE